MKFSTRIDTDTAADDVFALIADFPRSERVLKGMGVQVQRIDPASEPGTGLGWSLDFAWRGQRRVVRLDVHRFDRPTHITLGGRSEHFELTLNMTVVALSRVRTRLLYEIDIRPRTMRARLLLQTARLGKAQLDRKYARRMADFLYHLRAA